MEKIDIKSFPGFKTYNNTSAYSRMIARRKYPAPSQTEPFWTGGDVYDNIVLSAPKIWTLNVHSFPYSAIGSQYLAKLILTYLPDVLLLQEVRRLPNFVKVLNTLNEYCQGFQYMVFWSSNRVYRSYNVTMYKTSLNWGFKSAPLSPEYFHLPPYVQIEPIFSQVSIGGVVTYLLNVHAPWNGCFDHAAQITKYLDEVFDCIYSRYGGSTVIIGGDWNVVYTAINVYHDYRATLPPESLFDSNIDYYMISTDYASTSAIASLDQEYLKDMITSSGLFPDWATDFSDHFPVKLTLSL